MFDSYQPVRMLVRWIDNYNVFSDSFDFVDNKQITMYTLTIFFLSVGRVNK